jgi:hypothetical protein
MPDTTKRLSRNEARKLVSEVLKSGGVVRFSKHALAEMAADSLNTNDAANVLAAGKITTEGEFENGSWRYRVHTQTMCVVVAFPTSDSLVVITAWRKKS